MDNMPVSIEGLLKKTGEYVETRLELFRLKSVDKSADAAASLVATVVIASVILLFVIITSIGVALLIGRMTGQLYNGFFILGAFYGVIGFVLYIGRKKWLKQPFNDQFIQKML